MKVLVLQQDLFSAVSSVSRFVSPRAQIPVLANILFSTNKGKLTLSATNLETGISLGISAKVSEEGKVAIPAKIITELIGNIPAGQVVIEQKNGQVLVSSDPSFSANITTLPVNDFPVIPTEVKEKNISLPKEVIKTIANQVAFAAANDETRPGLTGILLLFGETLRAVATDGFRLSYKEIGLKTKPVVTDMDKLLVPAKSAQELIRVLGGVAEDEEVGISVMKKEGQIIFSGDSVVLLGKLIEGEFPDFERVIPKKYTHRALVDKEALIRAAKTGSVFAREAAGVVRLRIEKENLRIMAENQQYGREETLLEAKTEGEGVEAAFNYRYILDFLGSIEGDEVSFETEGPISPGVFQDTKDPSYKHLIMPVRIQG